MRIGILGGTFNPIHNGHIKMCKIAAREFSLDRVLLLVAGRPPHKTSEVLDQELRYAMTMLVGEREQDIYCSRLEMDRQGINYTVDSLIALKEMFGASSELFFIIGSDTLLEVKTWNRSEEVFKLTNFICIHRPGFDDAEVRFYMNLKLREYKHRIFFAQEKGQHVSSTNVRRRIAQRLNVSELLPGYIEEFVVQRNLYSDSAMTFDAAREKLSRELNHSRFEHTLGVIEMAERLATIHGADVAQSKWAALLHDCAKHYEGARALALCAKYGVRIDEQTRRAPTVIHAALGAALAKNEYGIHDEGILQAIERHVTGNADMTPLDKIIYLADATEQGRSYTSVDKLRELSKSDLDAAMLFALEHSIIFVIQSGHWLHNDTVTARNTLLERMKGQ